MAPSTTVKVYRDLFRAALKAIHYSTPARYKVRDILREAFRNEPPSSLNPRRVANTMRFLRRAQKYNGYEHKILKNLLFIRYWRENMHHSKLLAVNTPLATDVRKNSWAQYHATVAMLNESQDLCLRP